MHHLLFLLRIIKTFVEFLISDLRLEDLPVLLHRGDVSRREQSLQLGRVGGGLRGGHDLETNNSMEVSYTRNNTSFSMREKFSTDTNFLVDYCKYFWEIVCYNATTTIINIKKFFQVFPSPGKIRSLMGNESGHPRWEREGGMGNEGRRRNSDIPFSSQRSTSKASCPR